MRLLALDVGTRRIGMAVSDPMGILASPLGHVDSRGVKADVAVVAKKAREYGATRVLVGMPFNLRGKKGIQAQFVEDFCQSLREETCLEVSTWDERFSTVEAEDRLRQSSRKPSRDKGRIDAAAAAVILQSYLDSVRTK